MIKTLNDILYQIPQPLLNEWGVDNFLLKFQEALYQVPSILTYIDKIELFEITDGKLKLPSYMKKINQVLFLCKEPSNIDLASLECENLTYNIFLNSIYYQNNFIHLKYNGKDKSMLSESCLNQGLSCSEGYVITPEKMLYTTFNQGYLCIHYSTLLCDEEGNIIIPHNQNLIEYLTSYAIAKHWEERMFTKEEQAANFYQMYWQKAELWLRKLRGEVFLSNINPENYNNSILHVLKKLPTKLIYER